MGLSDRKSKILIGYFYVKICRLHVTRSTVAVVPYGYLSP